MQALGLFGQDIDNEWVNSHINGARGTGGGRYTLGGRGGGADEDMRVEVARFLTMRGSSGQHANIIAKHGVHFPTGSGKPDPLPVAVKQIRVEQECIRVSPCRYRVGSSLVCALLFMLKFFMVVYIIIRPISVDEEVPKHDDPHCHRKGEDFAIEFRAGVRDVKRGFEKRSWAARQNARWGCGSPRRSG